ncbi:MAG: beta-ketoacyl synthase N-terminal-like domain-containing protein, partial [Legionellaceae bacterium]|nr:beta-ketoacyl synthase N-terminal-like domain-containing protein [Legionellaceae bacterium]
SAPVLLSADDHLVSELKRLSIQEASHVLQERLSHVLADLLQYNATQSLDPHKGFFELGMDSLTSIEFSQRLSKLFDIDLSVQKIFDYPTLSKLSHAIIEQLRNTQSSVYNIAPVQLSRDDDAIAVIGMSFILPSGVCTADDLSEKLAAGFSFIQEIPNSRFDVDAYYDLNPDKEGKIYVRTGSFIDSPDLFDAAYFGVSPREAKLMDPQIRLLLEASSEALQHAHQTNIEGSLTGIFIGAMNQDYTYLLSESPADSQIVMGNGFSALSGRLAYYYGVHGPAITVDTACSSSLVSVCLAAKSLKQGDCDLAIAGGVNLIFSPKVYEMACKARMLSAEGRCNTFDEDANGYTRGEGVGVVILKRLSDALESQDNILAVIKGTAMNHDGASTGYSAPNGQSQERVIRTALYDSGLRAEDVHYVEAHGTATSLGDPIELDALQAIYGQAHDETNPLFVGSIKTNMGHLEGAAGIVGLIKSILQLQQGVIYPHINFITPTSKFDWSRSSICIPQEKTEWPSGLIRRSALSSFGFSGTNAHVIIEEAPVISRVSSEARPRRLFDEGASHQTHALVISAKSEAALGRYVERYQDYLADHASLSLGDLSYSASHSQLSAAHRAVMLGCTHDEMRLSRVVRGEGFRGRGLKTAWLFYEDEGLDSYALCERMSEDSPIFKVAVEACRACCDASKISELGPFVLEYALAQCWLSLGIEPDYLLGVGSRAYVCAVLSGVMRLEDGLLLAYHRPLDLTVEGLAEFKELASQIDYHPARYRWISSFTGKEVKDDEINADYWVSQLCEATVLKNCFRTFANNDVTVYLEIGAGVAVADETFYATPALFVRSVSTPETPWRSFMEALSQLYVAGFSMDWDVIYPSSDYESVVLPSYPFERTRYWFESQSKSLSLGSGLIQELYYELAWVSHRSVNVYEPRRRLDAITLAPLDFATFYSKMDLSGFN